MPIANEAMQWSGSLSQIPKVQILNRVLLGNPTHFSIEEAINVHMEDESGELNSVDSSLSMEQWNNLKKAYRDIGTEVHELSPVPGLPDYCFTANPSLVLPLPDGNRIVWLSKMAHSSRFKEVEHHASFFRSQNLPLKEFPETVDRFEGCGDGILHPGRFLIHAGTGSRSSIRGWETLSAEYPDLQILHYTLQDSRFYHLDTALAPLNENTALFVPSAFDPSGQELLASAFENLIPIPIEEALHFAGNAHCPDGKHVLLQKGNPKIESILLRKGFHPIPLETSEFRKSGGSVFCLKMAW
jgi:N-dimethylarginine dimethylaminohydrolase